MRVMDAFLEVTRLIEELLNDYTFKCESRLQSHYFSRDRKMGFVETMLFILHLGKKSLQLELNGFLRKVLSKNFTIKVPSFKENREKINPKAFEKLNNILVNTFYSCKDLKLYNNYRLLAVDGSIFEIPDTKLLKREFGEATNQSSGRARARVLCIYDVLNEVVVKSKICRYTKGERSIAKEIFSELVSEGMLARDLFIFDRGFVQKDLFADVLDSNSEILVRMPMNSLKEVANAKKPDQNIILPINGTDYKLRVVRFILSSGELEILLTSLSSDEYSLEDLKKLYFLRWGVETNYDTLKNKLEIENFTSRSKITIEQDFYATIFLRNMASLAKKQSDALIKKRHNSKNLKYEYKTNMNILIGTIREEFVLMMLERSRSKRKKRFKDIIKNVSENIIPIRPERSFERKKTKKVLTKFKPNHKRCL